MAPLLWRTIIRRRHLGLAVALVLVVPAFATSSARAQSSLVAVESAASVRNANLTPTSRELRTVDELADSASLQATEPLPCFDRPTTVARSCVVGKSAILIETGYYQNASKVGSTALAAYPLTRLRIGVARRLEIVLDAPTQYAESGYAGAGLYPRSQLGIGAKWLLAETPSLRYAVRAEASPPIDRNIPTSTHARYDGDVSAGLALDRQTSLNASVGVASYAENQHNESAGFRAGLALRREITQATIVLGEVTFRSSAANGNAQTAGAIYLQQALSRHSIVDVGLGTTFNIAGNAKAHYLAFGFSFRP